MGHNGHGMNLHGVVVSLIDIQGNILTGVLSVIVHRYIEGSAYLVRSNLPLALVRLHRIEGSAYPVRSNLRPALVRTRRPYYITLSDQPTWSIVICG